MLTLWSTDPHFSSSPYALLVLHKENNAFLALDLLLDSSEVSSKMSSPLIVRRINIEKASLKLQEKLTESQTFPQLLAVSKELEIEVVAVASSSSEPEIRTEFNKAIKNFIWDHSKEFSSIGGGPAAEKKDGGSKSIPVKKQESEDKATAEKGAIAPHHENHEGEIKRRRYTVYMSDLEKAMLYSLNHEVAQHAVITGEALNALQDYIDVLVRYFPGRKTTMR